MPLDERIKELIAVGASVTANCHPCVKYHVAKAKETGATEQEVTEAIGVGKMVRKGAAAKMDQLVAAISDAAGQADVAPDKECGSGS